MLLSRRALFSLPKSRKRRGETPAPRTHTVDAAASFTPGFEAGYWVHLHRAAMACRFEITLPGELAQHLDAAKDALDEIDLLEEQLTIFRDSSELSAINRDAAQGPVVVEPRLHALLRLCRALHRESGGAFDITSAPLSRVWGFLRRQGRLPSEEEIASARAVVGMDKVKLGEKPGATPEEKLKTVRFTRPGVSLNLGAIGKGYALDRIAEGLYRRGVDTALLSSGSSSLRAIGAGPTGEGYQVGLRDPSDHTKRYGTVTLADNALGVSGSGEQYFEHAGRRYGHIIDPRSGWPVQGPALVAVTAPCAALADALATAFYVGGASVAERYAQLHPQVSAVILQVPEGVSSSGGRPVATVFGRNTEWSLNRAA